MDWKMSYLCWGGVWIWNILGGFFSIWLICMCSLLTPVLVWAFPVSRCIFYSFLMVRFCMLDFWLWIFLLHAMCLYLGIFITIITEMFDRPYFTPNQFVLIYGYLQDAEFCWFRALDAQKVSQSFVLDVLQIFTHLVVAGVFSVFCVSACVCAYHVSVLFYEEYTHTSEPSSLHNTDHIDRK